MVLVINRIHFKESEMKIRKIITTVSGIMMAAVLALPAEAWTGNNTYSTSNETQSGDIWKKAFVQIQPSHNDGGYHYARGIIDYHSSLVGDGHAYTAYGKSASDSKKYTKTYRLQITNGSISYETSFQFRAVKVAHGSLYWPV